MLGFTPPTKEMDSMSPRDIIEGFETDFAEMVERFKKKSLDLQLIDFLDLWDEQGVDYIFANRYDPRELYDAISEMNKRLVLIAIDPKSHVFQHRVVAIYFLLCIFAKQPSHMKQKIRITCDDAVSIRALLSESSSAQTSMDVDFAWRYLIDKEAIDIVEQRSIYGPSMLISKGIRKRPTSDVNVTDKLLEARQESSDFVDNKIEPALAELEGMCVSYGFIKDVLGLESTQACANPENRILDLIKRARKSVDDYRAQLSES